MIAAIAVILMGGAALGVLCAYLTDRAGIALALAVFVLGVAALTTCSTVLMLAGTE